MDEPTAVLTVEQAAKRLRLSRSKAYELCQRGELPTVRFGRAVRVPTAALDRWIESNTRGAV